MRLPMLMSTDIQVRLGACRACQCAYANLRSARPRVVARELLPTVQVRRVDYARENAPTARDASACRRTGTRERRILLRHTRAAYK